MNPQDLIDVQQTLAGDAQAFARIIRRHQAQVTARMWRFTHDRQALEELVEEVFVEAYLHLRSFKGSGPLPGWLNTIATRAGYRYWKRRSRKSRTVSLKDWDLPALAREDKPDPQQAGEALGALLEQLRPRDRLVLTLMYLEDLPLAEVAQETGWSLTMVKVQAHRARAKLRALLAANGITGLDDLESKL